MIGPPRRIVVAGNLSLDDTDAPGGRMAAAPGGDALYAAIGARMWAADVRILTLVGDDYPPGYLQAMEGMGLGTELIRRVEGPTVAYRVNYGADGVRTFEFLTSPDRLSETSPDATDYDRIRDADWLHVAAMPIDAQVTAVASGRRAGIPISLDPHEEFVVGLEDRLAAMARDSALMPSELEARLLYPDLAALDIEPFAIQAVARMDAWHPCLVALKLGARGSLVRKGGKDEWVAAPATPVVDPTGAGDAYCGGFIAGWISTGSTKVAAICGTISAAEVIGQFGAFREGPWPEPSSLVERAAAMANDTTLGNGPTQARAIRDLQAAVRGATRS